MHTRTPQSALFVVALVAAALFGCGQQQFTGVVQSSAWVSEGWVLPMGTGSTADYIFVEREVLLDLAGRAVAMQNPRNILFLGTQYVGKKVKVHGEIQRDENNRRFIRVKQRDQIELL